MNIKVAEYKWGMFAGERKKSSLLDGDGHWLLAELIFCLFFDDFLKLLILTVFLLLNFDETFNF
jgi:hypothetical protein